MSKKKRKKIKEEIKKKMRFLLFNDNLLKLFNIGDEDNKLNRNIHI